MGKFFNIAKKFRVLTALTVFCLVSAKFFDVYASLPKAYYMYFNPISTQFAPSLLKMLAFSSIAAGAAFVSFTALALLFGRAYCSFFCLFGILMDVARRIVLLPSFAPILKETRMGKFLGKRFARQKFAAAHNATRAIFLGIAIFALAFGYTSLFGFIEPYSLYGKIMGGAVHPAACIAVNETSQILYSFENFSVRPVNGDPTIPLAAFAVSLIILAAITAVSAARGRLYCNTVCPVGAFLGFFAKFSLFKISIDSEKCVSCGMCERNCKAQCIDSKNKAVDFTRCVLCFNCAGHCPKEAVVFSINPIFKRAGKSHSDTAKAERAQSRISATRRSFPKIILGLSAVLCAAARRDGRGMGFGRGRRHPESEMSDETTPFGMPGARPDKRLAMPPGAQSVENFTEHCTACQLCTAACKAHILKPSVGELGLSGLMQPFMDFRRGYCIHNCHDCSKVCPTGAIKFISNNEKRHTKIGTAVFIRRLCVVKTDGTDCAACAEHCPVHAIEMLPFGRREESLYIPHVHSEVCIGCGACEFICPVQPHKAIVVRGIRKHRKAAVFDESMRLYKSEANSKNARKTDNSEKGKTATGDFPF